MLQRASPRRAGAASSPSPGAAGDTGWECTTLPWGSRKTPTTAQRVLPRISPSPGVPFPSHTSQRAAPTPGSALSIMTPSPGWGACLDPSHRSIPQVSLATASPRSAARKQRPLRSTAGPEHAVVRYLYPNPNRRDRRAPCPAGAALPRRGEGEERFSNELRQGPQPNTREDLSDRFTA